MLTVRMNDAAAADLGMFGGAVTLTEGLREIVAAGIEVRGDVVVWPGGAVWAGSPPGRFPDLTGWECHASSFHLEDVVAVDVVVDDDGAPSISYADQLVLLRHGVAFALEICRLAAAKKLSLRCVVSTNETNGTFRFHRIRPGEEWTRPNLDDYEQERIVVVDTVR
jgi:hypothetical protein